MIEWSEKIMRSGYNREESQNAIVARIKGYLRKKVTAKEQGKDFHRRGTCTLMTRYVKKEPQEKLVQCKETKHRKRWQKRLKLFLKKSQKL